MYDRQTIETFYCDEPYSEHPFFAHDESDVIGLKHPRFKSFDRALRYLQSEVSVGRLLDVGCGAGWFMMLAKRAGWAVDGVELSLELAG